MIRAIETSYAGCRFRSRLEARWAVFFDALGITWQYEAQGYELADGSRYLPDFWLPGLDAHAEVKGEEPTGVERGKILRASHDIQILMLGPVPNTEIVYPHPFVVNGLIEARWFAPTVNPFTSIRLNKVPSWNGEASLIFNGGIDTPIHRKIRGAYDKARSARFEHGQVGGFNHRRKGRRLK